MKSAVKDAIARRLETGPAPAAPAGGAARALEPLQLGRLTVEGRFFLAPLAGVSDWPFRVLARAEGAPLAYTEMVSSEGLVRGHGRTHKYLERGEGERPFAVQIFGANPEVMARAAAAVEALGADLVDVNMGCPVKKVCQTGAGAALLREPSRVEAILKAMTRAVTIPVQIKVRSGWDADTVNVVDVARAAEQGGAAAIAIHGRTRAQAYEGRADWSVVTAARQATSEIKVIGNGDIVTAEDALERLATTGVDAVMIGRAACGYPWIFREIRALAEGRPLPPPPDYAEWRRVIAAHLENLVAYRGGDESRAVREFRKHLVWYSRGRRGAAAFRSALPEVETRADVDRVLEAHFPAEDHVVDRRAELVTGPLSRAWG